MGRSPLATEQVTETSSPQLAGSSPNVKGSICGATVIIRHEEARNQEDELSYREFQILNHLRDYYQKSFHLELEAQ